MNKQEELLRQSWENLRKSSSQGNQVNSVESVKILKKVHPDITYDEYISFLTTFTKKEEGFFAYPFIPDAFDWFVRSFINSTKPSNVLVPFATGLECSWFDCGTNVEYHFFNKEYEQATTLFTKIQTIEEIPEQGNYDLILSALPLETGINGSTSNSIIQSSSRLLSDDGYCIFTFGKSIAMNTADKWLSKLVGEGLYCTAIIDMPVGSYATMSMVESKIVVFSKKKASKRFTALLAESDFADKIVDNFLKGKASTSGAKLGIFVDGEIRCYADYLKHTRIQNKNKALAKAYNGKLLMIKQVGSVHAPNRNFEFQDSDNAVYVPKLGISPVVTSITDLKIKAQNYFQIIVNTEMILPRFLAFFLNTEDGISLRQLWYRGGTIKAFNSVILGEMIIPCPALKLQSEYLKTYDHLEVLRVEIETLKDKLLKTPAAYKNIRKEFKDINNTGDKFIQWIETLPYPIATILKKYSVADDPNKKQEMLFYFYEAYAIFQATLLSAALNKNVIDCTGLKSVDPAYFEKASFGNWVTMDRALSKMYLAMLDSSGKNTDKKKAVLECFKTGDENLIKMLCNRYVCNILDSACNYRNSWKGHSGITSEALYIEHVGILDSMLHKLHENIKDLYERVRLIRPLSLTFSKGVFSNRVEVLTGSNSIFPKITIEALTPLDNTKLYLQILDTEEMLELPPYFILKSSPADVKNACYFYNRVEKGSTKYVSYHYDGRPEDVEEGEIAFDHIKHLLTN